MATPGGVFQQLRRRATRPSRCSWGTGFQSSLPPSGRLCWACSLGGFTEPHDRRCLMTAARSWAPAARVLAAYSTAMARRCWALGVGMVWPALQQKHRRAEQEEAGSNTHI